MNKLIRLSVLANSCLAFAILLIGLSSAAYSYYGSYSPSYSSTYNSRTSYQESPEFNQFPDMQLTQNQKSKVSSSNFDSQDYSYQYLGPMFERKVVYNDDLLIDKSSKQGFFYGRSNDVTSRKISNVITEKYVGASESLFSNNQNRRSASAETNQNSLLDYDGGFSFGKRRLFDQEEFSKDSYNNYYYKPYYSKDTGYFDWRW